MLHLQKRGGGGRQHGGEKGVCAGRFVLHFTMGRRRVAGARAWGALKYPPRALAAAPREMGVRVKSGLGGESVILAAWGKRVDFGVGRHFRYLVIWSEPQRPALLSVPVGGAAVSKVYYCGSAGIATRLLTVVRLAFHCSAGY